MQAPRVAIFVFMLTMLLDIKSRTESCLTSQSHTLMDFFAILERGIYDNNFDQYPHGLENVLMVFIRGFDVDLVTCSSPELCILHRDLSQERFPRWPLIFSIMRVMGAVRRLTPEIRKALEIRLRDILVGPRWVLDFQPGEISTETETSFLGIPDPGLRDLNKHICQELAI
jgi:hypothetical protein